MINEKNNFSPSNIPNNISVHQLQSGNRRWQPPCR